MEEQRKLSKDEIVAKLHELHECSEKVSKYTSALKEYPDKTTEINKWIEDEEAKIKTLKEELEYSLRALYSEAVLGKRFIRLFIQKDKKYVQLMHVTDIYKKPEKQSPWTHDVVYDITGELLFMMTNGENELEELDYTRKTTEFDKKPGYLDSNAFYGDFKGLNGWMEISEQNYDILMKQFRNAQLPHGLHIDDLMMYQVGIEQKENPDGYSVERPIRWA